MLIYDRRRCHPMSNGELRRRLTLAQRAKLSWLESTGWSLLFVRSALNHAYVRHETQGQAAITADGRVIAVRSLAARPEERAVPQAEAPAEAVVAAA